MAAETKTKKDIYFGAVGRRKAAIARVRLFPSSKSEIVINDISYSEYFPTESLRIKVNEAFDTAGLKEKFKASIKVHGGGVNAQAEAIRLGIARALVIYNKEVRPALKAAGFLKRDPRVIERKKFGLRKARRAPQWSKR